MNQLTERQRQIAALLMRGLSNKEIARDLGIAAGTVKAHLYEMFYRLGVNSRGKLVSKLASPASGAEPRHLPD